MREHELPGAVAAVRRAAPALRERRDVVAVAGAVAVLVLGQRVRAEVRLAARQRPQHARAVTPGWKAEARAVFPAERGDDLLRRRHGWSTLPRCGQGE